MHRGSIVVSFVSLLVVSTDVELKLSIKLRFDESGLSSNTDRFRFCPYLELIQLALSDVSTYDLQSVGTLAAIKWSRPSAVNPSRLESKPAS